MTRRETDSPDQLIERHLPLAHTVARRYYAGREPIDDLFQVACEALVKAAHVYDPARGHSFSSYAMPCMVGAIKRHFRDHTWSLQVPRTTKDVVVRLNKIVPRLEGELGREPEDAEVAAALGVGVEAVRDARGALHAETTCSIEAPKPETDNGGSALSFDVAAAPDEHDLDFDPILRRLPTRERIIIDLHFRHELTQGEIAGCVGISQMHVCRLLRHSLAQLRTLPEVHELAAAL